MAGSIGGLGPARLSRWFRSLPVGTRLSFWREWVAVLPMGVLVGVTGAGFCGFVAKKALGMSGFMLALLMGGHMVGMLLSGPLIGYFHNTRRVRALSRILFLLSLLLMSVTVIPGTSALAGGIFIGQILAIHIGFALVTTLRTQLWRANYPAQHRAKLVMVLLVSSSLINSLSVLAFSRMMDAWSVGYQWTFFAAGVCGVLASRLYSRLRVRREALLREAAQERHGPRLWAGLGVLKHDRSFRAFMSLQMFNGLMTLMVEIVLVELLADVFGANWTQGAAAVAAIPLFMVGLSSPVWSVFFDRYDIYTMRAAVASVWTLSRFSLLAGVMLQSLEVVLLSRLFSGMAMGGGKLAWSLGHMEFATERDDSLYMGAHVSLTGLRGIAAPFLGIALYRLIGPYWLFGLTGVGQALSALGFWWLPRSKWLQGANGRARPDIENAA